MRAFASPAFLNGNAYAANAVTTAPAYYTSCDTAGVQRQDTSPRDRRANDADILTKYLPVAERAFLDLTVPDDDEEYDPMEEAKYHHCLSQSCTRLRYLSVSWDQLEFTEGLLGNRSDTLTTLVLTGVSIFSASSCGFASLRNFMIVFTELVDPSLAHDLMLMTWLNTAPQLEVLSIEGYHWVIRPDPPTNDAVLPTVTLPNLRILRITSTLLAMENFLASLIRPKLEGLDLIIGERSGILNNAVDHNGRLKNACEKIMRQVTSFWRNYPSFEEPPDPLIATIVDPCKVDGDELNYTKLTLRSTPPWEDVDITQPFCSFSGPYCSFAADAHPPITIVHMTEDLLDGAALPFREEYMLEHITLDALFVEGMVSQSSGEWDSLVMLEEWLTHRKENGVPVRLLQIGTQKLSKARKMLKKTASELKKAGVVQAIEK